MSDSHTPTLHQPLNEEQQRDALYSILLRFMPEMAELRERGLDKIVLLALSGTSMSNPASVGHIAKTIQSGPACLALRHETINESLKRLIGRSEVDAIEDRGKARFHLLPAGEDAIAEAAGGKDTLFDDALDDILRDLDITIDPELAREVCKEFIGGCFAQYGHQMAKYLGNRLDSDQLLRVVQPADLFEGIAARRHLPADTAANLKARCIAFLRSQDRTAEELKFRLTQSFYFAQLLDLDSSRFSPLAEDAFRGAVLYVDTNVLISGLLGDFEGQGLLAELHSIAARLGIQLKVTRATLDETRHAAGKRQSDLARIAGRMTPELIMALGDPLAVSFLQAKEATPEITVADFFSPFQDLDTTLREQFGFEFEDILEPEMLASFDARVIVEEIQRASFRFKAEPKSTAKLNHDAAHLAHVCSSRATNRKTWFLTIDGILLSAASGITKRKVSGRKDSTPLAFPLLGFLQSVSPYVTSEERLHLLDIFSSMFAHEVFGRKALFDTSELALLAEMHEDVMATPIERLLPVLANVKKNVLHGQKYREENFKTVALALKKQLSSSGANDIRALKSSLDEERIEKGKLRASLSSKDEEVSALRGTVDTMTGDLAAMKTAIGDLQQAIVDSEIESMAVAHRQRLLWLLFGTAASVLFWLACVAIAIAGQEKGGVYAQFGPLLRPIGRSAFLLTSTLLALRFAINAPWPILYRQFSAGGVVLGALLFGFGTAGEGTVSLFANAVTFALAVGSMLLPSDNRSRLFRDELHGGTGAGQLPESPSRNQDRP